MKRYATIVVIAVVAALACSCGGDKGSKTVLVDINGTKITQGDLDFLAEINPRIQAQLASPAGKKRILDNLVEQDLLYQEAMKKGINRDPEVKAKVDLYKRVIIAQSLLDKEIDSSAEKYYKDNENEFKKLELSQIMVKFASPEEMKEAKKKKSKEALHTEEQALAIIKGLKDKIDKGTPFADVAKQDSEDTATKARGGDLGPVSQDDKRMASKGYEPLVEKAFVMKVGEVSEPIKTAKGYHLITVTKGIELEPFEQAKQAILFKIRNDAKDKYVAELKKEATIVYPEEEAKKAEAKKKAEEKKAEGQKAAGGDKAGAPEKAAAEKIEAATKVVKEEAKKAAEAIEKDAKKVEEKVKEDVKKTK